MDTSDPEIRFDEQGYCNHCSDVFKNMNNIIKKRENFDEKAFLHDVKQQGEKKKFDCVVGISGGVDSCYVLHWVLEKGLRPFVIHIDNGWNTEISENNIQKIVDKWGVELHKYVVDWDEFSDLQKAFLKSGTPDFEIPTDHMIMPILGMYAHKLGCKYIITGQNDSSESILPRMWSHGHRDWKYIKNIQKMFGTRKLKKYPHFTNRDLNYFNRKFNWFNLLNHIDYDKEKAKKYLMGEYDWVDYGGKHYESMYTRFGQAYILPEKFGYDKRRAHYSSLIVSNQMTREKALELLEEPLYAEEALKADKELFLRKLSISESEFKDIMSGPNKSYWDYPNSEE